jgi:sucrose phosphorylase
MQNLETVKMLLHRIYGETTGSRALERIAAQMEKFPKPASKKSGFFSQKDVVLITYGDSLRKEGELPLVSLRHFAENYLKGIISTIHFLPFFPWSSDDGFSVKDFHRIDPVLGTWEDVTAIGNDFKLMFDYVVNHFSSQGEWFANYLAGQDGFADFAIEVDPSTDLSLVTRPRSLPLLSKYQKNDGRSVHLWTTFSADQIDFNFNNLDVLEKMIEVLLLYAQKGASILRLDAIAYLWKEIGTSCIHLPQTHDMVKLFRAVLDIVAPDVMILTETNVPHTENISYFGNGRDEAQMVYNFTLPPLLFHAFAKQDARLLSQWAAGLTLDSDTTTFFNFTASHDGIGVRPLEGILPPQELDALIDIVRANGGQVSTKRNPDGSDSPYELNITYVDAILADPASQRAEKFLASQAVQYALPGVPATYIHSLLGSRNWAAGVKQTGRARTINRERLDADQVRGELKNPDSFRSRVFAPYCHLIKIRKQQPAFHPNTAFEIIDFHSQLFVIRREAAEQTLWAVTNTSSERMHFMLADIGISGPVVDCVSNQSIDTLSLELQPYQYVWLSRK